MPVLHRLRRRNVPENFRQEIPTQVIIGLSPNTLERRKFCHRQKKWNLVVELVGIEYAAEKHFIRAFGPVDN